VSYIGAGVSRRSSAGGSKAGRATGVVEDDWPVLDGLTSVDGPGRGTID